MKRLVLLGEGEGEVAALPVLVRKILLGKGAAPLSLGDHVVRARNASGLVKWNKQKDQADYADWIHYVRIAARHSKGGGVLAVFDGDEDKFPAGAASPFCAKTAAKLMAVAAGEAGAGKLFSLAVVFVCVEYEAWIIAGTESLAGKTFKDGRPVLPPGTKYPGGDAESHGKRWLEKNCQGYRPTRDQRALTELLDLNVVREKKLRSFTRLEHAIDQLLAAAASNSPISTPA